MKLQLIAGTCLALTTACAHSPTSTEPSLSELRAASERFQDIKVALAEGYIRDPENACVTADSMGYPASDGAMGVHYVRPDLLGLAGPPNPRVSGSGIHTDFRKPAILLYEPGADGSMTLVGVENLVFIDAWEKAGNRAPPSFHGVAFDRMADDPGTPLDEAHLFEPHYDQHVWLYRDNPRGVYVAFNPAVSCAAHKSSGHKH